MKRRMMKVAIYIGFLAATVLLAGALGSHAGLAPNAAYLKLAPADQVVTVGDAFTVNVLVDCGIVTADTVDAYIDFDTAVVQAEAIDLNTDVFASATYSRVDNATGQANLSASVFAAPWLSGSFRAATVRFTALAPGRTALTLARSGARQSDVFSGGYSIGPEVVGAFVTVPGLTATPTRTATLTRTPTRTATPRPPTRTPTTTRTALPTNTPRPTHTVRPTKTPKGWAPRAYLPLVLRRR